MSRIVIGGLLASHTLFFSGVYREALAVSHFEHKASYVVSPPRQTITVGATFDVSMFINTHDASVNAVELDVLFPTNLLQVVTPSSGKSVASIWIEPATYSNSEGTARFVGVVPLGIRTNSGLVTSITFKAISVGEAQVSVRPSSKILSNDGKGTNIMAGATKGTYTIVPRPPDGVPVYSETHPLEFEWYNNNNPLITWPAYDGTDAVSYVLDNVPSTVPDNIPETDQLVVQYTDINDGLWYFHLKARGAGVWGPATHYVLRVDTTPPAQFQPQVSVLRTDTVKRALVSFFTTDAGSGLDHYEVGIIDMESNPDQSPVFLQADSPFQIPRSINGKIRVVVRAVDRAGNVRDESIDITPPLRFSVFALQHMLALVALALLLVSVLFIARHYLVGHRLVARFRRIWVILARRKEKQQDNELDETRDSEKSEKSVENEP